MSTATTIPSTTLPHLDFTSLSHIDHKSDRNSFRAKQAIKRPTDRARKNVVYTPDMKRIKAGGNHASVGASNRPRVSRFVKNTAAWVDDGDVDIGGDDDESEDENDETATGGWQESTRDVHLADIVRPGKSRGFAKDYEIIPSHSHSVLAIDDDPLHLAHYLQETAAGSSSGDDNDDLMITNENEIWQDITDKDLEGVVPSYQNRRPKTYADMIKQ